MSNPQKLSQLLPKPDSNGRVSLPTTSCANLPEAKTKAALEVIARYGDAMAFLSLFNPKMQIPYTRDLRRVFSGSAPTLAVVNNAYGEDTLDSWLEVQIYDLSEFAGCKEKISIPQVEETACLIREKFGFLNVAEVMLFCQRFKTGTYGKFYGAVDPMVILGSLRQFVEERGEQLARYAREEEQRKKKGEEEKGEFYKRKYAAMVKGAFTPQAEISFSEFYWGRLYALDDRQYTAAMVEIANLPKSVSAKDRLEQVSEIVKAILTGF